MKHPQRPTTIRRRLSARATGAHHDWQRPRQASNVWQRHPVNHPQRPTTFGDVCPLEQPGPSRLAASATSQRRMAASPRETSSTTDSIRRRLSARATGAHHDWQRPRQASNVWQRHPVIHPHRPTAFGDVCPLEQPGSITICGVRDKPATSGGAISCNIDND